MTEYEINEKIRQAYTHSTPDILDAVLSDCKKEKGCAIMMTTNKKRKSLVTQLAGIAACLCLLIGGGAVFHNYQINHIVDATVSGCESQCGNSSKSEGTGIEGYPAKPGRGNNYWRYGFLGQRCECCGKCNDWLYASEWLS